MQVEFKAKRRRKISDAGSVALSDAGSAVSSTSRVGKSRRYNKNDLPFSPDEYDQWKKELLLRWFVAIANEKTCREWVEGWKETRYFDILRHYWPERKLEGTKDDPPVRKLVRTFLSWRPQADLVIRVCKSITTGCRR